VRIPENVPFEQALWIEPVNTCYKAIYNLHLHPDETVLVIGQGPIGILLASLARQTGATVLTSDLYPSRHAVAAQFDLHHPIFADKQDPIAVVKEHTEGRGADVVIVAVGGNSLIRPAMDAARFGGRVLLFAATQHGEVVIDPAAICMDEKSLIGSYSSSADVQQTASQLVLDGYPDRFNLTRLISHTFPLEQAAEAIVFASEPKPDSMKVVIQP
jgi:L-iditol 2-dehydrogenase